MGAGFLPQLVTLSGTNEDAAANTTVGLGQGGAGEFWRGLRGPVWTLGGLGRPRRSAERYPWTVHQPTQGDETKAGCWFDPPGKRWSDKLST